MPLTPTLVVAAKPPLNEIPGENQFTGGFRAFPWGLPASLQERADAVLGKYFHYLPLQNKDVTHLTTTFTPLQLSKKLSDSGVLAQVSLLITFPFNPAANKYEFHVQSLVKEGRALSDDLRATNNSEIVQAADSFVDGLVQEMKSQGLRPQ